MIRSAACCFAALWALAAPAEPILLSESPEHWEGDLAGYTFADGVITCNKGKVLRTKEDFENFTFSFEFKFTPGANNGIGLFMQPPDERASANAIEIQVLDDPDPQYKDIEPWQAHGSVYGVVPAKRGFLKPVGEWNHETITVKDRRITIVLNGETIVDADLAEEAAKPAMDGKEHPGLSRTKGRIGFLGHNTELWYRNVSVERLDEPAGE